MNLAAAQPSACDIAIVGAGPVGLLLAVLMRDLPFKIVLIEKRSSVALADPRSYILNRALIDNLIARQIISPADVPVRLRTLIVSSAVAPIKFRLHAPEQSDSIKYVIGAGALASTLTDKLGVATNLITGAQISAVKMHSDGADLTLTTGSGSVPLNTRVLIIADGAGSPTAAQLNIRAEHTGAGHSALVLNLASNRPLLNQAEQFLSADGPISIVPGSSGRLGGVIVSDSVSRLRALASAESIEKLMYKTWRGRYGCLRQIGEPAVFPVQPQRRPCRHQRALLLGDACCALSPVAAQGLSLGMDAAIKLRDHFARLSPDLSQPQSWEDFACSWQDEYRRLYKLKQDINQLYAQAIMNLGPARLAVAPALAVLGLSSAVQRTLRTMLSE